MRSLLDCQERTEKPPGPSWLAEGGRGGEGGDAPYPDGDPDFYWHPPTRPSEGHET